MNKFVYAVKPKWWQLRKRRDFYRQIEQEHWDNLNKSVKTGKVGKVSGFSVVATNPKGKK